MIICSCHNINHQKIEEFLKNNPKCSRELLSQKTKAGTDCGICVETLEEMIEALGNSKEKTNNRDKNQKQLNANYWEQS
jgi:bacterioferritin-associated ferredoxin